VLADLRFQNLVQETVSRCITQFMGFFCLQQRWGDRLVYQGHERKAFHSRPFRWCGICLNPQALTRVMELRKVKRSLRSDTSIRSNLPPAVTPQRSVQQLQIYQALRPVSARYLFPKQANEGRRVPGAAKRKAAAREKLQQPAFKLPTLTEYESAKTECLAKVLALSTNPNNPLPNPSDVLWRPAVSLSMAPSKVSIHIFFPVPVADDPAAVQMDGFLGHAWIGSSSPSTLHLYGYFEMKGCPPFVPLEGPARSSSGPEPFSFKVDCSDLDILPGMAAEETTRGANFTLVFPRKPSPSKPSLLRLAAFNGTTNLGAIPSDSKQESPRTFPVTDSSSDSSSSKRRRQQPPVAGNQPFTVPLPRHSRQRQQQQSLPVPSTNPIHQSRTAQQLPTVASSLAGQALQPAQQPLPATFQPQHAQATAAPSHLVQTAASPRQPLQAVAPSAQLVRAAGSPPQLVQASASPPQLALPDELMSSAAVVQRSRPERKGRRQVQSQAGSGATASKRMGRTRNLKEASPENSQILTDEDAVDADEVRRAISQLEARKKFPDLPACLLCLSPVSTDKPWTQCNKAKCRAYYHQSCLDEFRKKPGHAAVSCAKCALSRL